MKKPETMERRRFVKLLAASSAALLAAPLAKAAPAPGRKPAVARGASRQPSAATRKEIESQKRSLMDALKVVRDYDLPPGSPPAFVFRALRARKGS